MLRTQSTVPVADNPENATLRNPNTYLLRIVSTKEKDVIVELVAVTEHLFPDAANVIVVLGTTPTNALFTAVSKDATVV
jgi:hypothetical protein